MDERVVSQHEAGEIANRHLSGLTREGLKGEISQVRLLGTPERGEGGALAVAYTLQATSDEPERETTAALEVAELRRWAAGDLERDEKSVEFWFEVPPAVDTSAPTTEA